MSSAKSSAPKYTASGPASHSGRASATPRAVSSPPITSAPGGSAARRVSSCAGVFVLGQHDTVEGAAADQAGARGDVEVVPGGVHRVDPHERQGDLRAARGEGLDDQLAGGFLLPRWNGVLEVDQHRVRR